ncbi:MAG TPA: hypothetical protein VE011_06695 [Candidatus Dormibacteraeota bacterium]|nr:hypothetical protein [Candidatus Dormibacteraeota bacterium]
MRAAARAGHRGPLDGYALVVNAHARHPPRTLAGILATESATQIASFRSAGQPAID